LSWGVRRWSSDSNKLPLVNIIDLYPLENRMSVDSSGCERCQAEQDCGLHCLLYVLYVIEQSKCQKQTRELLVRILTYR
jgi:hypothetical protein